MPDHEELPPTNSYCLWCAKVGHYSHECRSTHGLNTPADRELSRLTDAALEAGKRSAPAVSGEAVAWRPMVHRLLNQLNEWARKYGEHQPEWLPPAGSIRLAEDANVLLAHPTGEVEKDAATEFDIVAINRVWDAVYSFVEPHRRHEAYQLALAAMNTEAKNG